MFDVRQELFQSMPSPQLNDALSNGARVVWIQRSGVDDFDVILEMGEADPVDPPAIVLDFLAHVSPATLEKKMLESPDLESGPGTAALRALMNMVPGSQDDGGT